jgi:hypothetical protein
MMGASPQIGSHSSLAVRSGYRGGHQLLLDVQPWGHTERIVNEPLEEALNDGYRYAFSFYSVLVRYRLVAAPCRVGISAAPGTE